MSLHKFLLLPAVIRSGMRVPRGIASPWEHYWGGIRHTGKGGEVLWDGASDVELDWVRATAQRHFHPQRPVVDLGSGNGRYASVLARSFPRVVGVDIAPSAVELARREWQAQRNLTFQARDLTAPGLGCELAAELGPCNVFIRGVLHILGGAEQRALVDNVRELLGAEGVLIFMETAFPGGSLDYLQFLGARGGWLPAPVRLCIEAGLPTPRRFGPRELDSLLPGDEWERLDSGAVEVHATGMRPDTDVQLIPGFFAVLRARGAARPLRAGRRA